MAESLVMGDAGVWLRRPPRLLLLVAGATITLLILTRYMYMVTVLWSFGLGIILAYTFLSPRALVPNLLFMYSRRKKSVAEDDLAMKKIICAVCGQRKCPRHRPELNIVAFQPWTNLCIPQKADQAFEELLDIVLKDFIYTWYSKLSLDEEFVDELRATTRFVFAVLLRRIKKIDIPCLVTEKLLKAGLQHVDCYIRARQKVGNGPGVDIQQATLEQYGPHLHIIMGSRRLESEYLRRLVECLFPYILRPEALHCSSLCSLLRELVSGSILMPALDALANPDMVNSMMLVFLDKNLTPPMTDPPSKNVELLSGFSQPRSKKSSCLRFTITDVMSRSNTDLLYSFMQFLKSEAAVNVMQFCLQCEDFNQRILNPELSQGELTDLHAMACGLYHNYCAPDALDRISFDLSIVNELKQVVEGPHDQILRLRTTACLFSAYEHAYDLLENTFLPLFHQSDLYYLMLCGSRSPSLLNKGLLKTIKKKESGFANIGNKIKEVFRSNTLDGRPLLDMDDELDSVTIASSSSQEDEVLDNVYEQHYSASRLESPVHDLSSWRVTIPRIGARPDPENMKKQFFVFIIDVYRVDMRVDDATRKSNWAVARRYNEFFVLDQKLREFHDHLSDCDLPPKKSFGTKNQRFIEEMKDVFEPYLRRLLEKPSLKGSELLYNFLTSETEFTTSFLPDINFGKMIKTVPLKLVKEKGQHLEPFLLSFLSSTEAPKPRPSKTERRGSDASFKSTSSEKSDKMLSSLYENNANLGQMNDLPGPDTELVVVEVNGAFESLVYIMQYVYRVPDWFMHILSTVRILFKQSIESYLDYYIHYKISMVCQEHRVISLVNQLRDVLFFNTDPPRTDEDKQERFERTLTEAKDFVPQVLWHISGKYEVHDRTKLLLELFQQPKLNKQLSYVFLDIVVQELFPELSSTRASVTEEMGNSATKRDG